MGLYGLIIHVIQMDYLIPSLAAIRASLIAQLVKNPPAMQETLVRFLGLGRSPGEGKGYPLQYSGLENSMGLQRVRHK